MQINALCAPCLGVPGIISVRIHIVEKDCVVIEHIVRHLSWAVLIYPDLAIRFFIVFFHYILLNLLLSFFPFFHSALPYYKAIIRTLINSGCQEGQILYTSTKNIFKNCISPVNYGPMAQMTLTHMHIYCFFRLYIFKPSFKLFSIFSFSFTLLQSYHSNFDQFWMPGRTDPIHIHEKHLQKLHFPGKLWPK